MSLGDMLNPMPTLPASYTGAHAAERLEHLRARLLERDITVEEVWDYIILNHQPHANMVMQPLAEFIHQQDIANFWWLYDWWAPVEKKPHTLPTPSINQFCWSINHTPGAPPVRFNDALQQYYQRCVAHCVAESMNVQQPGESVDERRKRLNRERMARTRGHRRVPDKVLRDNEPLSQQVRELERQCENLKADAKDADDLLRQEVLRHQTAMLEASNRRKDASADYKARIEELRTEIRNLTAKQ